MALHRLSPSFPRLLVALAAGIFFFSFPAYAQTSKCFVDGSLYGVFCSLAEEFSLLPRVIIIINYAAGISLFLFGMYGLKNYGDDPGQTTMRSVVIKLVLGAFLISLPLAMGIITSTLTGSESMDQNKNTSFNRPCLTRGSSIDGSRNNTACGGH